jgi:nicotinate-nucleotide adenylyltransferase
MNIGLFGGTFDPIHRGHMALARAAREKFALKRILFVPANVPPHRQHQPTAAFAHRYAMVALATAGVKEFVPSLLEAPGVVTMPPRQKKGQPAEPAANYTIDTIRRLKTTFGRSDRLFFLIGIDAFKDIAKWREAEALFRECEFIVASRPGYSLADVANALPEKLRPAAAATKPFARHAATGDLVLPGVCLHLLEGINEPASATAIRQAGKRPPVRFLDPAVAEYIKKTGLYSGK